MLLKYVSQVAGQQIRWPLKRQAAASKAKSTRQGVVTAPGVYPELQSGNPVMYAQLKGTGRYRPLGRNRWPRVTGTLGRNQHLLQIPINMFKDYSLKIWK